MDQVKKYKYRPLSSLQCIRVLELEPSRQKTNQLKGRLIEVDLTTTCVYDTLSYAWGYINGDCSFVCEGQEILVTKNCESAMRELRQTKPIRIWIDAICIDQDNVLERNSQVGMMDRIYRISKTTHVWLGTPESSVGLKRLNMFVNTENSMSKYLGRQFTATLTRRK